MTSDRRRVYIAIGGLLVVAVVVLTLLLLPGGGSAARAAVLSCSTKSPLPPSPPGPAGVPSGRVVPLAPAARAVFMQAVVLSNDGGVAVTVSCGRRSNRHLPPGDTVRFSVNEEVPVVLNDAQGRRCLYVGPLTPGGLGGLQPDGSQVIRTSQAGAC